MGIGPAERLLAAFESVDRAAALVTRCGYECAVIGGLAVSARDEPRFTRDADLAVAVADDDAAQAITRESWRLATRWRLFSKRPTVTDSPDPDSSIPKE